MNLASRKHGIMLRALAVLAVCLIGLQVSWSQCADSSATQVTRLSLHELMIKPSNMLAADHRTLLTLLDARTITRFDVSAQAVRLRGAEIQEKLSSLRGPLRGRLANPDLSVLMLIAGGLLISLEFNMPGTVVPGALGTLCLLMGVFGLSLLPLRYTAVVLLVAAVAMILLETKFASHGILATTGTSCLIVGLATLVDSPATGLRVHLSTAISAGLGFGMISFFLASIALLARRNKMTTGSATRCDE